MGKGQDDEDRREQRAQRREQYRNLSRHLLLGHAFRHPGLRLIIRVPSKSLYFEVRALNRYRPRSVY